jgi:hypothetical protein
MDDLITLRKAAPSPRRDRRLSTWGRLPVALLVGIAVMACSPKMVVDHPPKLNSVQEAASVRVAALSVARWEDYVDSLQAQYALTPDGALALAIPQTSISQASIADAVGLGLQIGLPQSTRTQTQTLSSSQGNTAASTTATTGTTTTNTSNGATNNANTESSNTTVTRGPGTAPASTLPAQTAPSVNGIAGPSGTVQTDPLTTYTAATAIYQEVQLLNRYLQDGALSYGYVPYIARMQISVMPFARNEPYDVYLDIGFFSRCAGDTDGTPISKEVFPAIVVPLLVTDDIEKGQSTSAENIARQLALSIAGTVNNIGVGANFSNLKDQFKSILAENLNSLFMVSRGADNVLEVRIGAGTSANSSGYAMSAQTHNLTFLMLVKREHAAVADGVCVPSQKDVIRAFYQGKGVDTGPLVQVSSLARLRNTTTGKELESDSTSMLDHARTILQPFISPSDREYAKETTDEFVSNLVAQVQGGSFAKFKDELSVDLEPFALPIWTGLTTVITMSQYNGTHFNLPYHTAVPDLEKQTVFIHDDCKSSATISLTGFNDAVPGQYLASLDLHGGAYSIAATGVAQSAVGAPLSLTFPTLSELARVLPDVKGACSGSAAAPELPRKLDGTTLTLRRLVDRRWTLPGADADGTVDAACVEKCVFHFNTVVLDGTAQLAQTVGLTAGADTIVSDATTASGKIRLLVTMGKDLDSVVINFSGATLTATPTVTGSATATPKNGGLTVVPTAAGGSAAGGPVVLDVTLQNLVAGRAVTISAAGQKNSKATGAAVPVLVLPIVAPAPAPKSTTSGS